MSRAVKTQRGTEIRVIDRLNDADETLLHIQPKDSNADAVKIILSDENLLELICEFSLLKLSHEMKRSRRARARHE